VPPKVQHPKAPPLRSITPEPTLGIKGPVLLSPDSAIHKSAEKPKSESGMFKKLFGSSKSKDDNKSKRISRAVSPLPPSPTPEPVKPKIREEPPVARTPEPRAPSPVPVETKEWETDFDGTHRKESMSSSSPPKAPAPAPALKPKTEIYTPEVYTAPKDVEEYRPATPPIIPINRSETPTRERTVSPEPELDRWAQIRKAAGQRAMNRNVAPPKNNADDEIAEVNIPRVKPRVEIPKQPKFPVKPPEEEDESVDARVARIRKRVQELTAGMGDD
jgi:hypothetical protein